jgi:hypothetical protein
MHETPSETDGLVMGYLPLNKFLALNIISKVTDHVFDLDVPSFLLRLSSIF